MKLAMSYIKTTSNGVKKILATLTLISLLAIPAISFAVPFTEQPATGIDSPEALVTKIETIGDWIFTGLLTLAAIFMVVAGYFFVTGGGEPEKGLKARPMLVNALIGIASGLAAKGLIAVINNIISA